MIQNTREVQIDSVYYNISIKTLIHHDEFFKVSKFQNYEPPQTIVNEVMFNGNTISNLSEIVLDAPKQEYDLIVDRSGEYAVEFNLVKKYMSLLKLNGYVLELVGGFKNLIFDKHWKSVFRHSSIEYDHWIQAIPNKFKRTDDFDSMMCFQLVNKTPAPLLPPRHFGIICSKKKDDEYWTHGLVKAKFPDYKPIVCHKFNLDVNSSAYYKEPKEVILNFLETKPIFECVFDVHVYKYDIYYQKIVERLQDNGKFITLDSALSADNNPWYFELMKVTMYEYSKSQVLEKFKEQGEYVEDKPIAKTWQTQEKMCFAPVFFYLCIVFATLTIIIVVLFIYKQYIPASVLLIIVGILIVVMIRLPKVIKYNQ